MEDSNVADDEESDVENDTQSDEQNDGNNATKPMFGCVGSVAGISGLMSVAMAVCGVLCLKKKSDE